VPPSMNPLPSPVTSQFPPLPKPMGNPQHHRPRLFPSSPRKNPSSLTVSLDGTAIFPCISPPRLKIESTPPLSFLLPAHRRDSPPPSSQTLLSGFLRPPPHRPRKTGRQSSPCPFFFPPFPLSVIYGQVAEPPLPIWRSSE